jgi:hypothetical protein
MAPWLLLAVLVSIARLALMQHVVQMHQRWYHSSSTHNNIDTCVLLIDNAFKNDRLTMVKFDRRFVFSRVAD